MKLIRDRHGRVSLLGKPTATPDPSWLAIQNKPFKTTADFHSSYPLDGGACLVDANDVDVLRDATLDDIIEATTGHGFNPASKTILELWDEVNGR